MSGRRRQRRRLHSARETRLTRRQRYAPARPVAGSTVGGLAAGRWPGSQLLLVCAARCARSPAARAHRPPTAQAASSEHITGAAGQGRDRCNSPRRATEPSPAHRPLRCRCSTAALSRCPHTPSPLTAALDLPGAPRPRRFTAARDGRIFRDQRRLWLCG